MDEELLVESLANLNIKEKWKKSGKMVLHWELTHRVIWGDLRLFGSGFCFSKLKQLLTIYPDKNGFQVLLKL